MTWIAASLLLLLFLVQNIAEMRRESCTNDEVAHLPAGLSYLLKRDFRMNPEHPPLIKVLAALPVLALHPKTVFDNASWSDPKNQYGFGYEFLYANDADRLLFWGRMPIVLLSVLLGFYVFLWAAQLYGPPAGLFALGLFAFCPNIIAHAHLVTMDLGLSAFLFISFYHLWRHLEKKEKRSLYWSALAMGAALASKFSAIVLFPIAILLLWIMARDKAAGTYENLNISTGSKESLTKDHRKSRNKIRSQPSGFTSILWSHLRFNGAPWTSILVYAGLATLVVQLSYVGRSYDLTIFFKGLAQVNKNHNPNFPYYLFGSMKVGGWWYYFLAAFLVKATVPFVILVFSSITALLLNLRHYAKKAAYLVLPAALFFGATSLLADPLGIRYVLPAFPFLMVFSSGLIREWSQRKLAVWGMWALLGWHIISSGAAFPNHIPYFNELVGGPAHGTEWLDDSNLDWGQELKTLKKELDTRGIQKVTLFSFSPFDNPGYYGIQCVRPTGRFQIETGTYVLSAHVYLRYKMSGLDWKDHARFITDIGHSMFIFQVP